MPKPSCEDLSIEEHHDHSTKAAEAMLFSLNDGVRVKMRSFQWKWTPQFGPVVSLKSGQTCLFLDGAPSAQGARARNFQLSFRTGLGCSR